MTVHLEMNVGNNMNTGVYKMLRLTIKMLMGLTFLALFTSVSAEKLPAHSFACHVTTDSGVAGIGFIQAHNMKMAKEYMLQLKAHTLDKKKSPVTSIIECIEQHKKEKFSDQEIQYFYKNIPR